MSLMLIMACFCINKPHYEYRVKHVHNLPDECTIFSISETVLDSLKGQAGQFDWFFKDPDKHSVLIRATPATEYLHHCVLNLLQTPNTPRLWVETLMTELLMQVLSSDNGFDRHSRINCETEKELHARHRESEIIHE